jgi:hypothetical protein
MALRNSKALFSATIESDSLSNGPAGKLVAWLESYINIVFPDNAIDYWSNNQYGYASSLKITDPLPKNDDFFGVDRNKCIDHVVSYVRRGNNEGTGIEVGFRLRDQSYVSLTWIKSFGSNDDCWKIAQAISHVLESIVMDNRIPELVVMMGKIPKKNSFSTEPNISGEVTIASTTNSLTVTTQEGKVLEHRVSENAVPLNNYFISCCVNDWTLLFTNFKVPFKVERNHRLLIDDLPGYVFTTRGDTQICGLYVLPPGGDAANDQHYIGYFPLESEAIAAAREHQKAMEVALA